MTDEERQKVNNMIHRRQQRVGTGRRIRLGRGGVTMWEWLLGIRNMFGLADLVGIYVEQ